MIRQIREFTKYWNELTPTKKYNTMGVIAFFICLFVITKLDFRNEKGVEELKERNRDLKKELKHCYELSRQKDLDFINYLKNENIKKRNIVDTLNNRR